MVASFYGMNVALPMARHPWAFVITLGISLALPAATAAFFWRRRWL